MRIVTAHKSFILLGSIYRRLTPFRLMALLAVMIFSLVVGMVCWRSGWLTSHAATAATVTGTVFQDYNANGTRDANKTIPNNGSGNITVAVDRGISGVVVTVYAADGSVAGTATTDDQGNYSINATGNGPYRVEFTAVPAGFRPGPFGADSRSTVQFTSAGNAGNVSLGLIIPSEFCQDNPFLATACYVGGDQNVALPVVISFPYSGGSSRKTGGAPFSDFDQPPHGEEALANQVGATWGINYARSTKQLYVSAFMKKHSGFGPDGTGAIYRIDKANPGSVSVYANLNTIFGANTAGADPHDINDFDRDNGNATWNAVGKVSLGQMAISDDEKKLFVMNLADRSLYELPLDSTPSSANSRRQAVPLNPPGCANAGDVRPFAVVYENNQLYVGMVCSAESTVTQTAPDGDPTQLQGYIYTVNPATLAFSSSPVFQFPLNYTRRCVDSAQLGPGNCFSAAWRPWNPVYRSIGTDGRSIYPQPWLTDIAFDRGNLVIGLRDRAGDQLGTEVLDNPSDSNRYYGVTGGDTLRACGSPASGWTLESNGRCGGAGTAPMNTGEGPGNGEFYFQDDSQPFTDEVTMGGMVQIPGRPNVVVNAFDPIPIFDFDNLFDGGPIWLNNSSGAADKSHRIYNGDRVPLLLFGKANGLSDLVALCDAAPIEIGNRIWQDTNGNGIQDAGEIPIGNITVGLFKNGAQVGTATTNSSGEFYFNASNVSGGILPGMAYEIRVDKSQSALSMLTLTMENADSSPNGGSRDSDATMVGGNAVISLTTGGPGENNHTYDIGFIPPGGGISIICPLNVSVNINAGTSAVVNYPPPTTTGQNLTVTCAPPSGSTFPVGTTTVTCTASNGVASVSCSFTVTVTVIPPGTPTISCPLDINEMATTTTGAVVTYPPPVASTGATVTCAPPSGSTFPIGATRVTCTATNSAGSASCGFDVTVSRMMKKSVKCDSLCFKAAQYYLFNLDRLPRGVVLISGVNGNRPISTENKTAIGLALRGNPAGVGTLTPLQKFNQQFVATQLSMLFAGSAASQNFNWTMLNCFGINFDPVTLSNGVTIDPSSMWGDVLDQTRAAVSEGRVEDLAKLADIFELLNGHDPTGKCGN